MMDNYASDEELVENIKKWWKANGLSIIIGLAIGLAAIFGWRYWRSYQDHQAEAASQRYEALSQAVEAGKTAEANEQGEALANEFSRSPYTLLAMLQLARLAVQEGDNAVAAERLRWVVEHADRQELKDIARLRLARVLLALNQLAEAETQLEQINSAVFYAEREELKGDLYLARAEPDKARVAYGAALAAAGAGGQNALLQMKLDNLPPAPPAGGQ